MAIREVDAISDAIIETEREIAGEAWGLEETERDTSGRSLEDVGEGLEGQHEAEDDDELEAEEAEGEEESEEEAELAIAAAAKPEAGKDGEGQQPTAKPERTLVPSGKLREATEARRAAEAERDALKAELAKAGETKTLAEKLDLALREIDNLKRAPRIEPRAAEPPKAETIPDIFEDPKGFTEHLQKGFQTELNKRDTQLANQRVETSMAIAHAFHKDTFEKAFESINKLSPNNPDDRVVVQRIYSSPNPGEALVSWHKRNETFARVGDDPAKFEENIRNQTREALMKDPEFIKQIVAAARGEAARGDNGQARTVTRLPKSLSGASGSNLGAERGDPHQYDDTDQAVAESAWR
jgi:hypothetical protein